MKSYSTFLTSSILLYIAGAMQQTISPILAIAGYRPDFLLALICPLSLLISSTGAMLLGFAAGIIHGSLAGANMAHYIISQVVICFFLSRVRTFEIEINPVLAYIFCTCASLASKLLLIFLAPPAILMPQLTNTIGTSIYSGIIATLIYCLLQKVFRPKLAWK